MLWYCRGLTVDRRGWSLQQQPQRTPFEPAAAVRVGCDALRVRVRSRRLRVHAVRFRTCESPCSTQVEHTHHIISTLISTLTSALINLSHESAAAPAVAQQNRLDLPAPTGLSKRLGRDSIHHPYTTHTPPTALHRELSSAPARSELNRLIGLAGLSSESCASASSMRRVVGVCVVASRPTGASARTNGCSNALDRSIDRSIDRRKRMDQSATTVQ